MPTGIELAVAYISLAVETSGVTRDINRAFAGAERTARTSGEKAGRSYAGGASRETLPIKRGISQSFDDTARPARASGERAGRAYADGAKQHASGISKALMGGVVAGLGAIELGGVLKDSVTEASGLNEAGSKIVQIYGQDGAAAVQKFAATSATSLGNTKLATLEAAGTFGTFGKSAGLSGKQLATFSTSMTSLASDMASFNNTTPDQAIEAIGAAMRGEAEPIRAYGVLLDDASLKAEALDKGILKANVSKGKVQALQLRAIQDQKAYNAALKQFGPDSAKTLAAQAKLGVTTESLRKATEGTIPPLTAQQRVLAAQSLIMKQTEDAQGDFSRTSGGLANQQRILAASLTNVKAGIGQALLPIVLQLVTAANTHLVPALNRAVPKIQALATQAGPKLAAAFRDLRAQAGPALAAVLPALRQFATNLGPGLSRMAASLPGLAGPARSLGDAFGFVSRHSDLLVKALPLLAAGFVAVKTAQMANEVVGRNSVIGFGLELTKTVALTASNYALAASNRAVAAASTTATVATAEGTAVENVSLLTRIRSGIATAAKTVAEKASAVASKAMAGAQWLLNAAMEANPIGLVIIGLVALGAAFVVAYRHSETFRRIVQLCWSGIKTAAAGVVAWFVGTVWPAMRAVFTSIGSAAMSLWTSAIAPVFRLLRAGAALVFGWFVSTAVPWMRSAFSAIGLVVRLWWAGVKLYFGLLKSAATVVFGWIKDTAVPWMRFAFNAIGTAVRTVWSTYISPAFAAIKAGAQLLWQKFQTAKTLISAAFSSVGSGIRSVWGSESAGTGIAGVFAKLKLGVAAVKTAFETAKKGISTAWTGLKSLLSTPIRAAINVINSPFISGINSLLDKVGAGSLKIPSLSIAGLADGGVIPGPWRGPTADNVLGVSDAGIPTARVNPGEYITRVRSTRSMMRRHPGVLEYINKFGRLPGHALGGLAGLPRFGDGGWWDKTKHAGSVAKRMTVNAASDVVHATSRVVDAVTDPVGAIRDVAAGALNRLGSGMIPTIMKTMAGKALDSLIVKVKGVTDALTGEGGGSASGNVSAVPAGAMSYQAIAAKVLAAVPGIQMTSGFRPGAVTSMGGRSFHGMGRAADFAPPSMAAFHKIKALFPHATELIYTPAGMEQLHFGRPATFPEPVRRIHYNHIHVAMAKGGMVPGGSSAPVKPLLFDSGGVLPEGLSVVMNKTGAPEPLRRVGAGDGRMTMTGTLTVDPTTWIGVVRGTVAEELDAEAGYQASLRPTQWGDLG